MKKFARVLGAFLALLLVAIVMIPLVVDVDQYRPQIVDTVSQQIHGKLELGKLSLSLWGQVRVEVSGLKLLDSTGEEVVRVKDAYFHLPFLSILSGAPILTFKMNQPLLKIIKYRNGKLNVMSLMKEVPQGISSTASNAQAIPPSPVTGSKTSTSHLPGIVTRAKLGIELQHALLEYRDELSGLTTQVKDLNLELRDVSLSHPTEIELWADLDTKFGKSFILQGPARLTGKVQPTLKEGKIDQIELSLLAKFLNAEINAQGTVSDLASSAGLPKSSTESRTESKIEPRIGFNIKSNTIDLKPWVGLFPMLKEYELGGSAQFVADVSGSSQKMGYHAKITVAGLTAKAPQLKAQPTLDGVIQISPDQINPILITMKAPGNDLKIQGKLVSFTQPQMDFEMTSTGMDLDQLVEFPPPAQKAKAAAPEASNPSEPSSKMASNRDSKMPTEAQANFDAMLAPLRVNKILADSVAKMRVNLKMIKARQITVSDVLCKLSFSHLTAGLDQCDLKIFSGTVTADAHFQLKPKTPTYQFNAKIDGLNMSQAVESQMALFKNTVKGLAHLSMSGQGASFNPDPAISNLKVHGKLKVDQATFATIDVMKMVSEALNRSLSQLGDKVPVLKGKSLGALPHGTSRYDFISSDFTIADNQFIAPDFYAKAVPQQGIDLKGSSTIGIKNYSLNTFWDVIDTYNITRLRDISVEQNGVKVEHIFAEGSSPVHFPIHVDCNLMAPCYSYTEVPSALAHVALKNIGNALTGRAKEELRKKAESIIKQVVPPAVQNKLNDKLNDKLQEKLKDFFH